MSPANKSDAIGFTIAVDASGAHKVAVARTYGHTGWGNAEAAIERALQLALGKKRDLCLLAASSKATEDVLAVRYLAGRLHEQGYICKHNPQFEEHQSTPGDPPVTNLYLPS